MIKLFLRTSAYLSSGNGSDCHQVSNYDFHYTDIFISFVYSKLLKLLIAIFKGFIYYINQQFNGSLQSHFLSTKIPIRKTFRMF